MSKRRKKKKQAARKKKIKDRNDNPIPLEDKPLSMQKGEIKEEPDLVDNDIDEDEKLDEELEQVHKRPKIRMSAKTISKPIHHDCGGMLQRFGHDGRGNWWECSKCRSQFYTNNPNLTGEIGDDEKEKITYKVRSGKRGSRRLT
jgi:hypothetical protein